MRLARFTPLMLRASTLCFSLCAATSFAQGPGWGFPPYGSFQYGGFDAVNRQNLNVNFAIPIVSGPGRGLNLSFAIAYNSLIWQNVSSAWNLAAGPNGLATWGWNEFSVLGSIQYKVTSGTVQCPTDVQGRYRSATSHTFRTMFMLT